MALNSHLLEAKVTIDKLSEDNVSVRAAAGGQPRDKVGLLGLDGVSGTGLGFQY